MCSSASEREAQRVADDLDALAATDVVALDDHALREELLDLLVIVNRAQAELARRVDVFDRRGLAEPDGFRTTRSWLIAFGRLAGGVAGRMVRAARTLRDLPKLAAAAQSGEVSAEHVQLVSRLSDEVGIEHVAEIDAVLADAARTLDTGRFQAVCARVQAHADPDGGDPAKDFDKRGLTLAPVQGMMWLRGQLDPEGGAALATALDAVMVPPGANDDRNAAQRRADALVELARLALSGGKLPDVGGHRPQVGVLLYPQALSPKTLAKLAEIHKDEQAGRRLREFLAGANSEKPISDWTRPGVSLDAADQAATGYGYTKDAMRRVAGAPPPGRPEPGRPEPDRPASTNRVPAIKTPAAEGSAVETLAAGARKGQTLDAGAADGNAPGIFAPVWSRSGWADPPWLSWLWPLPPEVAQRIACDADIWRVILDPATGMPLDVGRGYRLVPHWIRRALVARDRGCRWPGCSALPAWCDAHHLKPWSENGQTSADQCLLLCRWHHGLVHEGGWSIRLNVGTGEVTVLRPGGFRYDVPGSRSGSWTGPSSFAPPTRQASVDAAAE
jgi:hypothetical protein